MWFGHLAQSFLLVHCSPILLHETEPSTYSFLQYRCQNWIIGIVKINMFLSIKLVSLDTVIRTVTFGDLYHQMSGFQEAFAALLENIIHKIKIMLLDLYEAAFCQGSVIFRAS